MKSKNIEPNSVEAAFQYVMRLLAARDYTSAKIREKLRLRGFSHEICEDIIARLEADHWLDDRRFAERFSDAAAANGRFFGVRLRLEMRRRGVPVELIEESMGRLRGERNEQDDLRSLLVRRFPSFSFAAADEREKRKVINFLVRRGFGFSAIMQVLKFNDTDY